MALVAGGGGHAGGTAAARGCGRCLTPGGRHVCGGGVLVGHAKCSWVPGIATHTRRCSVGRSSHACCAATESRRSWLLHPVGAIACGAGAVGPDRGPAGGEAAAGAHDMLVLRAQGSRGGVVVLGAGVSIAQGSSHGVPPVPPGESRCDALPGRAAWSSLAGRSRLDLVLALPGRAV